MRGRIKMFAVFEQNCMYYFRENIQNQVIFAENVASCVFVGTELDINKLVHVNIFMWRYTLLDTSTGGHYIVACMD